MANKYYAVKVGRIPGIYQTWDETKEQINGYSGAVYKRFATYQEAKQFILDFEDYVYDKKEDTNITDLNDQINKKIDHLSEDEVIAFVDGSYNAEKEKAGFGTIIISKGGEKYTSYKSFGKQFNENLIALRNVFAELEGVKEAVLVAVNSKKTKITIYYDYTGIEMWATKKWKAKNKLTQAYTEFIQEKMKYIEIEFIKVPAHSGIIYNEEADALAKKSLLAKGHKTYKDGSVYFIGFSSDDWKAIVDYIDEENRKSLVNLNAIISIQTKEINETRKQLIISDFKNQVIINLYGNRRSYVQGKQSVLFQKIIATAIEFLSSDQIVVETLNSYHALTISKEEVEEHFERLLPNYRGNYDDKNYSNLLSATYNAMLTGYMPDYTCLVTPIFRAYEFYLHKILNEKMELDTAHDNGTNNFGYFTKTAAGSYECSSSSKNKLSDKQLAFLNDFYTNYNKVRHPYSHWSSEDYDTAMIDSIEKARVLLENGLNLINEYYILF